MIRKDQPGLRSLEASRRTSVSYFMSLWTLTKERNRSVQQRQVTAAELKGIQRGYIKGSGACVIGGLEFVRFISFVFLLLLHDLLQVFDRDSGLGFDSSVSDR